MTHKIFKVLLVFSLIAFSNSTANDSAVPINLPAPNYAGSATLEQAILLRRSVRTYSSETLTLSEVSQLLWACQGVTAIGQGVNGPFPLRSAPSAGALYPLEVYLVVERVDGLEPGLYKYVPGSQLNSHSLSLIRRIGKPNKELARAMLGQEAVKQAAVNILICGECERLRIVYGERAERYMWMETGHAAQNLCLQATALGLQSVTIGAFVDDVVKQFIAVPHTPLYNISIGRTAGK